MFKLITSALLLGAVTILPIARAQDTVFFPYTDEAKLETVCTSAGGTWDAGTCTPAYDCFRGGVCGREGAKLGPYAEDNFFAGGCYVPNEPCDPEATSCVYFKRNWLWTFGVGTWNLYFKGYDDFGEFPRELCTLEPSGL